MDRSQGMPGENEKAYIIKAKKKKKKLKGKFYLRNLKKKKNEKIY